MKSRRLHPTALLLFVFVVFAMTACQAKKAGNPALPQEFEATLVPSVPLDAYVFASQGQDTRLAGSLTTLPQDVVVKSAQAWLTPSGDKEVFGARILFSSPQEAQRASDAITSRDPKLWIKVVASSLFLVYGDAEAAKNLTSAIQDNKFSKLESNSPEGWASIQNLPASPSGKVVATGFLSLSDTPLAYVKANVAAEMWSQIEPIISQAKINKVAIASYLETPIDPAKVKSVDDLKEHKVAVMVTGKSSYPGFLLSLGMKIMGPRVGLIKEEVTGGSAFKSTFVLPHILEKEGITAHLMLSAAGSQVYMTAALDDSLNKKLLESALAQ